MESENHLHQPFRFLISKANSLKALGTQPKYTLHIQEKNTHKDQGGNRVQKSTK
jgi:hypothetical protein